MNCRNLLGFGCYLLLGSAAAKPPIIDDFQIIRNFQSKSGEFAENESYPSLQTVQDGLKDPLGVPEISLVESSPSSSLDSVFVVGSVYDCGKCDKWHPRGLATAWVLASDGILCTNYHVLANFKGEIITVASRKGEVYPVTEILLADKANDVAVFRVEATGLTPLAMAKKAAAVGEKVSCLSHPKQRFFHHSFGEVSRYHMRRSRRPRVAQMSITADYAQGSSGGPILNQKNEVVGMVVSTSSLYPEEKGTEKDGKLQMVVKSCVPAFAIQELLAKESKDESASLR